MPPVRVATAYLVFVGVGADGGPRAIPQVAPETDLDHRRFHEATVRREYRLARRAAILASREVAVDDLVSGLRPLTSSVGRCGPGSPPAAAKSHPSRLGVTARPSAAALVRTRVARSAAARRSTVSGSASRQTTSEPAAA